MAESEEELKSLLMNVKEETEKIVLKLNIQKTKIMASGPIEGGNRTGSILKGGLHLGLDCGLRAICLVSMETAHQLENQAHGRKSPRAFHCLKEYCNYLCNGIESYILLCLLGYDHKPIDNCPLLTT